MTIKEVANLAGVSISTVSKIINNKDQNINPRTREKVLKIVKEYNYSPYSMIKNISNTKSFVLGLLLRDSTSQDAMLNGILHTAQKSGYSLLLFDSENNPETELKNITKLVKNKVDGVIWEHVNDDSLSHEKYFSAADIAVSHLNAIDYPESYNIDFTRLGYDMTQKLLDNQHNKVACLLKDNSTRSHLVLDGFKKCLYDNGLTYNDNMQLYSNKLDYVKLTTSEKATGVIASHYDIALSFYEELAKRHQYVPADVSLITLKDDAREELAFPSISSIEVPYRSFGEYIAKNTIDACERNELESSSHIFTAPNIVNHERSINIPNSLREKKIAVVGCLNIDKFFTVDSLPKEGKTTRILNVSTSLGGKGINQAIGASKFGAEVSLIGETGNDASSSYVLESLEKEGVSTAGVRRNADFPTGKAYIYLERNGESSITILPGANNRLTPESIRERQHFFENAAYCLLSTESPIDALIEAAKISKKHGAKNIVKPATLKSLPDELLENIDILVPNKEEMAAVCPSCITTEERAEYFFNKGVPIIIVTLGHEGCYLKTKDTSKFFPAANFEALDTTGGADAFISALSAFLLKGYPIEKTIQIATCAAGFCISRQGSVPSLVDKVTLEAYLGQHAPELLNLK